MVQILGTTGDVAIPQDESPFPDDEDNGNDDAPYGYTPTGRVRKRPIGSRSSYSGRKPGMSNEKLARQAASLLAQTNALGATGLMFVGMPGTASAIANANDGFEEQAYHALLPDPALCRAIVRVGGTSAKLSLFVAYAMMFGAIAPHAVVEMKANAEMKRKRREDSEG